MNDALRDPNVIGLLMLTEMQRLIDLAYYTKGRFPELLVQGLTEEEAEIVIGLEWGGRDL